MIVRALRFLMGIMVAGGVGFKEAHPGPRAQSFPQTRSKIPGYKRVSEVTGLDF